MTTELVRYWICRARSGEVIAEVEMSGTVSMSRRFGGGKLSASLSLDMPTRDGSAVDWLSVRQVLDMTQPGRRTIAATTERGELLGEWLIMQRSRSTGSGELKLSGVGWDEYPGMRSLNTDFVYDAEPQSQIAVDIMERAFKSYQSDMQITIPAWSSQVRRTGQWLAGTAYFADVLDEISAPGNGFEWCVDLSPEWDGDALARVRREVAFGAPTLSRPSMVVIEAGETGTRHGGAVIEGGEDYGRSVQSAHGVGAGEGQKMLRDYVSDLDLMLSGHMFVTANWRWSQVSDPSTLRGLIEAELAAAQDYRDPFEATVPPGELRNLPQLGHRVRLLAGPTLGWPDGLDELVRVGEVSFSADGPELTTVKVVAI